VKITKRQLRRIIKEEKAHLVNEITTGRDVRQLTLNQNEVNQVEAMRSTLDKMYFEYQKIKSVPPAWLDDSAGEDRYSKLELLLFDASEELSDLAHDMKKGGI
jgi:hypothetical protein